MGKGYNNYMCKKPFHPGSKANIKRAWMAEQKTENDKRKQEDLKQQYEKEQDLYTNRAMISTENKDKLELNFMYEAPPGAKREHQKEDDEPEYKFEWQRKYNAPREDYAKGNEDITDQPFGIAVRNVRCIKCHKWGHINTDRECPLFSQASTSAMPTTSMDPMELMRQMRDDGYGLKENVLGHRMNPSASNQQFISSEESDPEADFLNSLSLEDKKKLLRKLKKLSKKHEKMKRKKRKKKAKSKNDSSSESDDDKYKKKKSQEASDSDDELSEKEHSKYSKERKKLKYASRERSESDSNAKDRRKKESQKHIYLDSDYSDNHASRKRDKHKYDKLRQPRSRSSSSISEDSRSKYQSKKINAMQHSSAKKRKYRDVISKESAKYEKRRDNSSDSEDDRSKSRSKLPKAANSRRYHEADSDDSDLKVSTKEISSSKKSKPSSNSTKLSQSKSSKWYSSDDSEIDQTYSSRASKSNVRNIKVSAEDYSYKSSKWKSGVSSNATIHDKGKEMPDIVKPKEQTELIKKVKPSPKRYRDNAPNSNEKDGKKSLKTENILFGKPIKSERISELDLNSGQKTENSISNVNKCVENVDKNRQPSHKRLDGFTHNDPHVRNVKNYVKPEYKYKGEKHDKFQQKYRDDRSPSMKQKYKTHN